MKIGSITIDKAKEILKRHCLYQKKMYGDEISQSWFDLKYHHSLVVYETLKEIIDNVPEIKNFSQDNKKRILVSAILHDIGRFYQIEAGILNTSKRHGILGREILRKENELEDETVALCIEYHDYPKADDILTNSVYKSMDNPDQNITYTGLKALRDADMLANFQEMVENNDLYIYRDNFEPLINDEMMDAALTGRPYNKNVQDLVTVYDSWVARICWMHSYHYDYSKQMQLNLNLYPFLFEYVERLQKQSAEKGYTDQTKLDEQIAQIKKATRRSL